MESYAKLFIYGQAFVFVFYPPPPTKENILALLISLCVTSIAIVLVQIPVYCFMPGLSTKVEK